MATITELSQLDLNRVYSYADYLNWQLDEAVELIKGKIMLMAPAPNVRHQGISMDLSRSLSAFFLGKPCRVFAAPFDVRLYDRKKSLLASADIHTVVQPDLCVICNPELLDEQGCNGAPDWIIEILSKSNTRHELRTKFALYEESGVTEYWLVFPDNPAIEQFALDASGHYQLQALYAPGDVAASHLFPDLAIDVNEVFASPWN